MELHSENKFTYLFRKNCIVFKQYCCFLNEIANFIPLVALDQSSSCFRTLLNVLVPVTCRQHRQRPMLLSAPVKLTHFLCKYSLGPPRRHASPATFHRQRISKCVLDIDRRGGIAQWVASTLIYGRDSQTYFTADLRSVVW